MKLRQPPKSREGAKSGRVFWKMREKFEQFIAQIDPNSTRLPLPEVSFISRECHYSPA